MIEFMLTLMIVGLGFAMFGILIGVLCDILNVKFDIEIKFPHIFHTWSNWEDMQDDGDLWWQKRRCTKCNKLERRQCVK